MNDHWANGREALKNMVSQAGFEPATFPLGTGLSNCALSVVKPAGNDGDVPRFDGVHQAMLFSDAA